MNARNAVQNLSRRGGVHVQNLSKTYPDGTRALHGVTFDIRAGTIAGYLGPNGAGKTTTVHILSTVIKPSCGEAQICGFDVVEERTRVRKTIGLATQDISLDWLVSVQANIDFFGQMFGLARRDIRKESTRLLADFGLLDKRASSAWSLSGGQKRRLQLVIALLKKPGMLFADEPSLGLDPIAKRVLHKGLEELSISGTTIMYASNDMVDLERLCSSVIFLNAGIVVGMGPTRSFVSEYGGGTSIAVESEKPIPQDRLQTLKRRWEIDVVSESPLRWVEKGDESLYPGIVTWLVESGLELQDIQIRRPTLEDAFLRLVRGIE
ncbi:ABC transporter ATP-binding protein [Candidatus Bipolaricaulota bacterium]